jgi:hypothetical protein
VDVDFEALGAVPNQFDPERAESYGYGYRYQYDDRSLQDYYAEKEISSGGFFSFLR